MTKKSIQQLATELSKKVNGKYYLIKNDSFIFFDTKPRGIIIMEYNKNTYNVATIKTYIRSRLKRVTVVDKNIISEYYEAEAYVYDSKQPIYVRYNPIDNAWQSHRKR